MEAASASGHAPVQPPTGVATRRRAWRRLKDRLATRCMAIGGISVIVAIVLIFFYLLYVVLPLFRPARMEAIGQYALPGPAGGTLYLALDEYGEIGLRVTATGEALFFRTADGTRLDSRALPEVGAAVTAFGAGDPSRAMLALGLADGRALVFRHRYSNSFPNDRRVTTPSFAFPLGDTPVVIDPAGRALRAIGVQGTDERVTVVAIAHDGRVLVSDLVLTRSLLDDSVTIERRDGAIDSGAAKPARIALSVDQRSLYVLDDQGRISLYDLTDPASPRPIDTTRIVQDGATITALDFVAGGISLLAGDSRGRIAQWFPVRDAGNDYKLTFVRAFHEQHAPIVALAPEHHRKGFLAAAADGTVGVYHTTAHRTLKIEKLDAGTATALAISPRADAAVVLDDNDHLHHWLLHNEHPEVSWRALWGKVWYESRQQPEYVWQSSAATSDFEPKLSLTPLAFGTLKAALYAMLFAIPLALGGAVYAGYFMSPRLRGYVKPTIEVMAAIPTVILGFLAGLWLAPFVEHRLAGVFLLFVVLPLAVVAAAYIWYRLPAAVRYRIPNGWEGALLVPVVCVAVVAALGLGDTLESGLFSGDLAAWMTHRLGVDYDQRNSLVVGIAMGFAVIPTIFSISEDAVFGVPRHLTVGSLALGATPWQTMVRVVLLTASPGMFSGVMIGLGRAVGETMIVLMATGNTPIIDMNLFQGFRALSANIAVEMPESEVGSSHYRILFLAALVLFLVTFLFNTAAEIIRQRLRTRYSGL